MLTLCCLHADRGSATGSSTNVGTGRSFRVGPVATESHHHAEHLRAVCTAPTEHVEAPPPLLSSHLLLSSLSLVHHLSPSSSQMSSTKQNANPTVKRRAAPSSSSLASSSSLLYGVTDCADSPSSGGVVRPQWHSSVSFALSDVLRSSSSSRTSGDEGGSSSPSVPRPSPLRLLLGEGGGQDDDERQSGAEQADRAGRGQTEAESNHGPQVASFFRAVRHGTTAPTAAAPSSSSSSSSNSSSSSISSPSTSSQPADPWTVQEVFEVIRGLNDPEHPLTLEDLNVVSKSQVSISQPSPSSASSASSPSCRLAPTSGVTVTVRFTPTIPHCSMATLIGLTITTALSRSLPPGVKSVVMIKEGTHNSERPINKQLADKERVCAALENGHLRGVVNQCIKGGGS